MARYCVEKGTICDYANEHNQCSVTGCMNHNIDSTVYSYTADVFMSRICEICGKVTDSIDTHICKECAKKLYNILYK